MGTQFTYIVAFAVASAFITWFLLSSHWARFLLWTGRRGTGMRSAKISAGGLAWHFLEAGEGPVLVAVHGFGADADHWLRITPALRRHFRVVAPDLIGFGDSESGDGLRFDIDAQVDRLHALLQQLGIETCIMAGSSMGGWIASRFAQRYPQQVRALWLLAPLGVRACERGELLGRIERGEASPLAIATVAEFERYVFRPMFVHPPHLPRPLKMHYGRRAVQRSPAMSRMFSEVASSQPALEEIVADLRIPVLVQWGSEDRAVHVSGAACLRQAIAIGKVITQAGIGHLPMLEAGHRTAREFLEFARHHGIAKT